MGIGKAGKAPFISQDALAATLAAQSGLYALRNQTALLLSHYLGLRSKELASLDVGDIYHIHTKKIVEVVRLLPRMCKGGAGREVFLVNDRAREMVRLFLEERDPQSADEPLFVSQKHRRFTPNTMQQLFAQMYAKAHVAGTSHSGRRTFATRLIEAGADLAAIQEMMGHKSAASTIKYAVSNPLRQRTFAGMLA